MTTTIARSGITNWTPERLPDLAGRLFIITGGNSGIGLDAARILGRRGADVVLAVRSPGKGAAAVDRLQPEVSGRVETVELDLASLASVRRAAGEVRARFARVDGLINNAGIMQTPERTTADGFELQFGTNHLGHMLWTHLLLDRVEAAAGRVVQVSSIAHKLGRIDLDDLMGRRRYSPTRAYAQSKLANLMFALELNRRLDAAGMKARAIAVHPGYAATALQSTGPTGAFKALYRLTNRILAQRPELGAVPTVLAAAAPEALGGAYYGPTGFGDARGPVGDSRVAPHALDAAIRTRLWEASEALLGIRFRPGETAPRDEAAA